MEPEITVSLGKPEMKPWLICRVVKKEGSGIMIIKYKGELIDTRPLDYEGGFDHFVSDIIGGFHEAYRKMDLNAMGTHKEERPLEFNISLGDEENRVCYVFRGGLGSYGLFIESSIKLQTALWALSIGEPLLYRFWNKKLTDEDYRRFLKKP